MYPAVAGAHDNFLLFARASDSILRDPRRNKVCAQMGKLYHLLDNIFDLVVWSALGGGEVVECCAVRAGPQVAHLKPALCCFFGCPPGGPEPAPEGLEFGEGACAVNEGTNLT